MILNTWKNLWRCKNYIKFNKAKNFNFHAIFKKFASFFGILIDFVLIILRDDTVPKKFLCRNTKHEIASDLSSYKNNLQIFLSLDIYILFFMSCIMKGVLIFYQFFLLLVPLSEWESSRFSVMIYWLLRGTTMGLLLTAFFMRCHWPKKLYL